MIHGLLVSHGEAPATFSLCFFHLAAFENSFIEPTTDVLRSVYYHFQHDSSLLVRCRILMTSFSGAEAMQSKYI
jgi:hypothetical protein